MVELAAVPGVLRDPYSVVSAYARLIRFHYHVSFSIVLLGVLTVTRDITVPLLLSLAGLYLSFNILLYGGIYTFNAIEDARSDGEHPRKRWRPIPAGEIELGSAWKFAAVLLGSGFLAGWVLFGRDMLSVFLGFVGANLFYTLVAKKIAYLDIAFNSVTYPLRYFMGTLVAGGGVSSYLLCLVFLVAIGACAVRRRVESNGRYSSTGVLVMETAPLVVMGILRMVDQSTPDVFYACATGTHVVLIFGPKILKPFRRALLTFWSN